MFVEQSLELFAVRARLLVTFRPDDPEGLQRVGLSRQLQFDYPASFVNAMAQAFICRNELGGVILHRFNGGDEGSHNMAGRTCWCDPLIIPAQTKLTFADWMAKAGYWIRQH